MDWGAPMGWAVLAHTTWERANEIAAQYELGCVAVMPKDGDTSYKNIKPIVHRIKNGDSWYNYAEDGTYRHTRVVNRNGDQPFSYSPCYYVPDKIRWTAWLSYLKEHLERFKNLYYPFLLYYTADREEVIYSVYWGIIHAPLSVQFDNPLLLFDSGHIPMDGVNLKRKWKTDCWNIKSSGKMI